MEEKNIRTYISTNHLTEDEKKKGLIGKALSLPGRSIRYKRAKNSMNKSIKKINNKADNFYNKLVTELPKKLLPIKNKANSLINNLDNAEKEYGSTSQEYMLAHKKLENFQKDYLERSNSFVNDQFKNLDSAIDKIIAEYTKTIEDRIEKGGYVFKTELTDKAKTDLKALWIELTENFKNEFDTKKLGLIKDKITDDIDDLSAKTQIALNKDEYAAGSLQKIWFGKSSKEPANLKIEIPSWP